MIIKKLDGEILNIDNNKITYSSLIRDEVRFNFIGPSCCNIFKFEVSSSDWEKLENVASKQDYSRYFE